MGLSYQCPSGSDEQSSCCGHCVRCVHSSGNTPSRNGHPNAHAIHHTPSEYSYYTNNVYTGNTADEEEGVDTMRDHRYGLIQQYMARSFTPISKAY